jgi:hypothetical protein
VQLNKLQNLHQSARQPRKTWRLQLQILSLKPQHSKQLPRKLPKLLQFLSQQSRSKSLLNLSLKAHPVSTLTLKLVSSTLVLKKKSTQQQSEKKVSISKPRIIPKKLILKLKPLVLLHKLLKMVHK